MRIAAFFLLLACATGTLADRPHPTPPLTIGGYRVLAGDFHIHNFPFSASTLAPWDLVFEARRQGLDVIAITPHNSVLGGRIARWFGPIVGGPIVLAGEEIHGPRFHLVAVGTHSTISWRLSAPEAIAEIHRQGGVAIAAHPMEDTWPAYAPALKDLDGAELWQPGAYSSIWAVRQFQEFAKMAPLAPIGSSDYHGPGPLGICRTYLFVTEVSEAGVLDAIRSHRTMACAAGVPGCVMPPPAPPSPAEQFLALFSRVSAIAALLVLGFGRAR